MELFDELLKYFRALCLDTLNGLTRKNITYKNCSLLKKKLRQNFYVRNILTISTLFTMVNR